MSELEGLTALLEVLPDAVFVVAEDGLIVAVNAQAETLTGYVRADLVGRPVEDVIPADIAAAHVSHRASYFTAARARPMGTGLDIRVRRRDGSERPADIALSPLELDGRRLALASMRDITDRRLMEERLRESEVRQRLLIDGVTDYAIFMLDTEGNVATWNRGAERIKGYTGEEVIGKHFSVFYPPSRRRPQQTRRMLEVAASQGRFEDEGWRIRKDGSRFWGDVVITPVRDGAGQLRGYAKITRDVSAQRRQRLQIETSLAVTQAVLRGLAEGDLLTLVAGEARHLLDADLAMMVEPGAAGDLEVTVADGRGADRLRGFQLKSGERSLSRRVIESGRPLVTPDLVRDRRANAQGAALSRLGSAVFVPLRQGAVALGCLIVGNRPGRSAIGRADVEPLAFLATQASLALEHARIQEELQRLALVDERDRIGRELHDGAIQAIFAIGMSVEGLAAREADPVVAERLRATVVQLDGVIKDLRNYIYGLRPSLVSDQALEQALRQLVDDFASGSGVTAVADIDPAAAAVLSPHSGEVVLLAGEALSNVGRHAAALTCRLTLRGQDGMVILEIEDDGQGFDTSTRRDGGQGLRNLAERATRLGGEASIESSPGDGTTVTFRLPGQVS